MASNKLGTVMKSAHQNLNELEEKKMAVIKEIQSESNLESAVINNQMESIVSLFDFWHSKFSSLKDEVENIKQEEADNQDDFKKNIKNFIQEFIKPAIALAQPIKEIVNIHEYELESIKCAFSYPSNTVKVAVIFSSKKIYDKNYLAFQNKLFELSKKIGSMYNKKIEILEFLKEESLRNELIEQDYPLPIL